MPRPRAALAFFVALVVALGGMLIPQMASAATPATVSAATFDWGVKSSFRGYIASPIAKGKISTLGGVTGTYRWTGGSGAAAADASSASIAFPASAGVHFQGHEMAGGYALDLAFTRPQIVITSPTTAKLLLDVQGRQFKDMTSVGEAFTLNAVEFATLALPTPASANGRTTWTNAAATLTEAGASAFGGFYPAGTALDPVTFSAAITVAQPVVTPTVALSAPTSVAPGGSITFAASVSPATAAGTIVFRLDGIALAPIALKDASATLTTTLTQAGSHTVSAEFTPLDPTKFSAATSLVNTFTVRAPEQPGTTWTPSVQVFREDGVTPAANAPVYDGDILIVKAAGFDPTANVGGRGMPIPADRPQGDYVVFGNFAPQWQPSTGAASAARQVASQQWALTSDTVDAIPASFQGTVRAQWTELHADGTFTAKLTVGATDKSVDGGKYGVYTYAGGGMKNAAQELAVLLDYRGARPVEPENPQTPTLTVTAASQTPRPGEKVTFTAAGLKAGQKVRFEVHSSPVDAGAATADAAGNASREWTVPAGFAAGAHEVLAFRVSEQGESEAAAFARAPLQTAATIIVPTLPEPGETVTPPAPAEPVCVARSVTSGSLDWGLKASFRSYVQGPIAKGTFSGGSFTARGGALNLDAGGRGQIRFAGTISATGHDGLLNLRVSNPRLVLDGNGSGSLYAHVTSTDAKGAQTTNGTVRFASVSLPKARSGADSFAVSGASAQLTAAGAKAFAGFYEAGTALDSLSFRVSLGGATSCDTATAPAGHGALATTGSEQPVAAVVLSTLLLLGGAGLVLMRRRRVA